MNTTLVSLAWITLGFAFCAEVHAQATIMNTQGVLEEDTDSDGEPDTAFDGTAYFKFAIVDAGANTLWSHDGSSVGGSEPTDWYVSVDVDEGVYSVDLGEAPMDALTTDLLDESSECYLRIWLTTDLAEPFEQMDDQRIVSAPFALHAESAERALHDFTVSGDLTATGNVTVSETVWSTSGGFKFPDGTTQTSASDIMMSDVWLLDGNAGTDPGSEFIGTTDDQRLVFKVDNAIALRLEPVAYDGTTASGPNVIGGMSINSVSADVKGATIGGGGVQVLGTPSPNVVTDSWGTIAGGNGNTAGSDDADVLNSALAAVGGGASNTASGFGATVAGGYGNEASGDYAAIGGGEDNVASGSHARAGAGRQNEALGDYSVVAGGYGNSAAGHYSAVAGGRDCFAGGGYSFAVGRRANVWHYGSIAIADGLDMDLNTTAENQMFVRAAGGVRIGGGVPGNVQVENGGYTTTIELDGMSGTTTTRVLEITGGSDVAEPFPMSDSETLVPGTVVVIDRERPGHLAMSRHAYDRRVAGVISGAGGVRPGLTLAQVGVLEGDQHVAIGGRVYALADAAAGPIEPGDPLTTSETPGHVMRAVDPSRSSGAIVGKAMSALSSGQGLVLVLISLQ